MAEHCEACSSIGEWSSLWQDYELWILRDRKGDFHLFCPKCYDNQSPTCCDQCGEWFIGGSLIYMDDGSSICPACVLENKERKGKIK